MALTTCKDCGREISTSAASCPGCGAPLKQSRGSSFGGFGCGCASVAAVVVVIGIVIANAPSAVNSPSSSTAPSAPRHPFEPAAQDDLALSRQIQRLINSAGERCDAIANLRAGGRVDNGDVFMLADCAGGATHSVLLTPDDRVRYYMSCSSVFNPVC